MPDPQPAWHTPITGYTPGTAQQGSIQIQGIPGSSGGQITGPGSWQIPNWVGSAAGGALGLASSAYQAGKIKDQQKYAYKLARRYRRSITTDMRAAGLNPILAVRGGFGSGGASFGAGAPAAPNLRGNVGINTALDLATKREHVKQEQIRTTAMQHDPDIAASASRAAAAGAHTAELGIPGAQADADLWSTLGAWGKGAARFGNAISYGVGRGMGAARNIWNRAQLNAANRRYKNIIQQRRRREAALRRAQGKR